MCARARPAPWRRRCRPQRWGRGSTTPERCVLRRRPRRSRLSEDTVLRREDGGSSLLCSLFSRHVCVMCCNLKMTQLKTLFSDVFLSRTEVYCCRTEKKGSASRNDMKISRLYVIIFMLLREAITLFHDNESPSVTYLHESLKFTNAWVWIVGRMILDSGESTFSHGAFACLILFSFHSLSYNYMKMIY